MATRYELVTGSHGRLFDVCLRCGARFAVGPSNFARTDHTRMHERQDAEKAAHA